MPLPPISVVRLCSCAVVRAKGDDPTPVPAAAMFFVLVGLVCLVALVGLVTTSGCGPAKPLPSRGDVSGTGGARDAATAPPRTSISIIIDAGVAGAGAGVGAVIDGRPGAAEVGGCSPATPPVDGAAASTSDASGGGDARRDADAANIGGAGVAGGGGHAAAFDGGGTVGGATMMDAAVRGDAGSTGGAAGTSTGNADGGAATVDGVATVDGGATVDRGATPDGSAAGGGGGAAGLPSPRPGELAIVELLINPAGTDTGREWIEIVNRAGHPVSLAEMHVADLINESAIDFGSGPLQLAAGARAVLVQSADPAKNGGVTVGTAAAVGGTFGTLVSLNNDSDEISVCVGPCPSGTVIDRVGWDSALGVAYDGHALVIDDLGRRCPAAQAFGDAGSFGTPGGPNAACP